MVRNHLRTNWQKQTYRFDDDREGEEFNKRTLKSDNITH